MNAELHSLVTYLLQQARNADEMIAFNDRMKAENPNYKPLITRASHVVLAMQLRRWADLVSKVKGLL